jgi:hypothetical protein
LTPRRILRINQKMILKLSLVVTTFQAEIITEELILKHGFEIRNLVENKSSKC